ncbi:MAG: hypothetical protein ACI35V_09540 [Sphingobacterium composti]|uniref:hypothetical protein n=1 Tax=Sphingobacterium composti TaxID=363260 RepID=UPI00135A3B55|nr:hypothetical protein [Sphingobacterium composti Ten et al. 2007 non Yoo et al. 2007]
MEKETMVALICLGFFTMIVLSIYFIMKYKTLMQPKVYDINEKIEKSDWQKPGIVMLGTGIGALIVGILNTFQSLNINGVIVVGVIVISTGIGLIVAQQFDKKDSIEE